MYRTPVIIGKISPFRAKQHPPLRVGPNNTLEQYIIDDTVLPLVPYCLNKAGLSSVTH